MLTGGNVDITFGFDIDPSHVASSICPSKSILMSAALEGKDMENVQISFKGEKVEQRQSPTRFTWLTAIKLKQ